MMKKETLNKLKTGNVVVYMHFVNAWGQVTDTGEVARFKSVGWAENFVAGIRAEEEANKGRYVGHIYEVKVIE
jgi:hypothetical protein